MKGFEPLQQESKSCMLPLHHRLLYTCWNIIYPYTMLSEKQDSNLQPPASKAGKLPIVIFPVICTNSVIELILIVEVVGLEPTRS